MGPNDNPKDYNVTKDIAKRRVYPEYEQPNGGAHTNKRPKIISRLLLLNYSESILGEPPSLPFLAGLVLSEACIMDMLQNKNIKLSDRKKYRIGLRLLEALCGLKQAPLLWNLRIVAGQYSCWIVTRRLRHSDVTHVNNLS